jgi:hypothetical protein
MNTYSSKYDLVQALIKTQKKDLSVSDFWIQESDVELPKLYDSKGQLIVFNFIGKYQVREDVVNVYFKESVTSSTSFNQ